MAYGRGMSRLYAERGREQAGERSRYERELKSAEGAAKKESERGSLWQTLGSVVGAGVGLFAGGPSGAYKGWQAGKEVGRWGSRATSGYDPKDYAVSTDVGKFGVSQKYDLQDINKQFQEAHDSQFWQDVAGTGVSAMSIFNAPELAGSEWWDKPSWDFSKAASSQNLQSIRREPVFPG
tara:strand:+ start:245 stop:781 length:537 start_codon:yes stop_codon:yes gene_type:complete